MYRYWVVNADGQTAFQQKQINKVNFLHVSTVILLPYPPVYILRNEGRIFPQASQTLNNDSLHASAPGTQDKETNLVVHNPIKLKGYINKNFPSFGALFHKLDFFKKSCLASGTPIMQAEAAGC